MTVFDLKNNSRLMAVLLAERKEKILHVKELLIGSKSWTGNGPAATDQDPVFKGTYLAEIKDLSTCNRGLRHSFSSLTK